MSPGGSDGPLTVSMTGQDHVVFKGVDTYVPLDYPFELVRVSMSTTGC